MNRQPTVMALPESSCSWRLTLLAGAIGLLLLLRTISAQAGDQPVPWECSNYAGEAQTRCLNTFIELQREEIGKLKGQLQFQEGAAQQLKQQAAATEQYRQPVAPPVIVPANPYLYSYIYPPALGLGLYIGRPWIYGGSYYRPYWGPYLHGHWRHHR
ncbi:MAG: hypothetical protein RI101_06685 [Nitrospira sp.]|jgi:hypothetical protein|nr:hypothetical protein [Nitrospira sp.]